MKDLIKQRKKMLGFKNWNVCESCGYRESDVKDFLNGDVDSFSVVRHMTKSELNELVDKLVGEGGVADAEL